MNELVRWVGRFRSAEPCEGVCPTGVNVQFTEELTFRLGDEWLHYEEHAKMPRWQDPAHRDWCHQGVGVRSRILVMPDSASVARSG